MEYIFHMYYNDGGFCRRGSAGLTVGPPIVLSFSVSSAICFLSASPNFSPCASFFFNALNSFVHISRSRQRRYSSSFMPFFFALLISSSSFSFRFSVFFCTVFAARAEEAHALIFFSTTERSIAYRSRESARIFSTLPVSCAKMGGGSVETENGRLVSPSIMSRM